MAHSIRSSNLIDNTLLPAIIISLGLHVVALTTLRAFNLQQSPVPPTLEIELQKPKPVPPPPPPPEPPKPEPAKSIPKKLPPPPVRAPLPTPEHRTPEPITPTAPPAPPPPQVIAAAPSKDAEPTFVAPPAPEPEKPKTPPPDIDAALGNYGSLLAREFAKYKQYPRIAQMRGWQGIVKIKLEIDASGTVASSTVVTSSNFESLDNQALEMVKKATPLPLPPEALRHKPFTITVPVVFRLE
jgi:protein TonB